MRTMSKLLLHVSTLGFVLLSSGCIIAPPPDRREERDERWCSNHPRECDHERWCADHPGRCER